MVAKDFEHWNTMGTSVFLRNKLVLSPEGIDMKGAAHTTLPLSKVGGGN